MQYPGQNSRNNDHQEEALIEIIRALPPEKVHKVEDFIDFLQLRDQDRQLIRESVRLSEKAFIDAWDNPEDVAYDRL